ncbi:LOW QUALITY PROTEIN: interferon-induced GTP-binding protein Mx-like [Phoenicopterus ruber ruber]
MFSTLSRALQPPTAKAQPDVQVEPVNKKAPEEVEKKLLFLLATGHYTERRFSSPSLQPSSEAFAVPLPPDLEDEGLLMSENKIEKKPNYEQKKQYYREDKQAAEHTLYNQYEEKIQPCVDLVNSLSALRIEKDPALPAITAIRDQSSRKSSILEALPGIAFPRGNGKNSPSQLIKLFNQDISQTMCGEEQLLGNEIRLFTKIHREFQTWEVIHIEFASKVKKIVPSKVWKYEDQYCGREFPGFTNYRTFEDVIKEIIELEEPAVEILSNVIGLVEEKFMELTTRHFANFHNLNIAAKTRIEDIREKQAAKAERHVQPQFKMERIVYCQDDPYISNLNSVKAEKTTKVGNGKELQVVSFVQEMVSHMKAYFRGASKRLSNQIPLIILSSTLHDFGNNLQTTMLHLLQEKDKLSHLLQEDSEAAKHRSYLSQRVNHLTKACQYLKDFTSPYLS